MVRGQDDDVAKWISDYMSRTGEDHVDLSIEGLIYRMFSGYTNNYPALVNAVSTNIITRLDSMADEMFLLDIGKAPHASRNDYTITYCYSPNNAPTVSGAIQTFCNTRPWIQQIFGTNDRISVIKTKWCIPMFAYAMIDQNYIQYFLSHSAGKHLYEGTPGDQRDWKTLLPNLRPYSLYHHIDWVTEEKQAIVDAYGASEAAGIIHCEVKLGGIDTDNYYLWRTPDYMPKIDAAKALVASCRELAETELTDANADTLLAQLEAALDKTTTEMTSLKDTKEGLIDHMLTYQHDAVNDRDILIKPEIAPVAIRNDGDNSTAAAALAVRRDNVLSSPVIVSIMMEELNKQNKYKNVMTKLEQFVTVLEGKIDLIKDQQ